MEHEERSLRLVHRIEAFSDLVMGFSVGLLGLTLVIPVHAVVLVLHPFWLVSYFWTFALIGLLWMRHQRLFSVFFVPTPFCIALNFLFLSTLGLIVYFVQVFAHVRGEFDQAIALVGYVAALAVALISLGILFAIGIRTHWDRLLPKDRYGGLSEAAHGIGVGTALLLGCIATPIVFLELRWNATVTLVGAAVIGFTIVRAWLHFQKPRIVGAAHAGA